MRHHHGDGDGALPALEAGVPFNDYLARMLADVDNVRGLCDVLEAHAGELPPLKGSRLDARLSAARAFMDALAVMPSMIRVASPSEVARGSA